MEILELINSGSRRLKNKNIYSHKLDSEILLSKVLNKNREELLINLKGYREYKTTEYGGEVIISLIFMTTQKHIVNKINLLNRRYLN